MEAKGSTIWTRDFILLGLSYLLLTSSFYFLLPTLPVYVVDDLGENKSKIGYIIGIYSLSALAIRPFSGYALDVLGRKPVFLTAMTAYIIVTASYFLTSSFSLLMLVRFFHGLTWGILTTGGATIAADMIPAEKRGEGLGYFGLTITLSMALGPLIGLWILNDIGHGDFNYLFALSLAVSLTALVIGLTVKYSDIKQSTSKVDFSSFFEKWVIHIALVMLFAAITYAGMISFITLLGEELKIKNPGAFFLVYAIGIAVLRPFAGKMMDKRGPGLLILSSFVVTIAGLTLLSYADNLTHFLSAAFIIGLGNGIIMPTVQAMIINMVKPERRGVANSTLYSALDLGIGFGSVLLGYVTEATSISTMYFICGLMLLAPLTYFITFALKDYNKKVTQIWE